MSKYTYVTMNSSSYGSIVCGPTRMFGKRLPCGSKVPPLSDRQLLAAPARAALDALLEQREEAREAGVLGYLARVMVQATMPHREQPGNEFTRSNGYLTLTILAPSRVGLPYGTVPRLLLAWLTTEAVRTRSPELVLGPTLASFMRELDMMPTGGRWGTIPRLRTQMRRLFSAAVSCIYTDTNHDSGQAMNVARRWDLWWDPKQPAQAALWTSTVTLSADFFEEVIRRPVPVDMSALRALRRSPLALDTYAWLTYRMSYLRQPVTVPWEALQLQFGADYERADNFRAAVRDALRKVLTVYPEARVAEAVGAAGRSLGLRLEPSPTHIPARRTAR